MWKKLTGSKSKPQEDSDSASSSSQPQVLNSVLNQHPNLSVFHDTPQGHNAHQQSHEEQQQLHEPPPSPSKRNVFKRLSRQPLAPPPPIYDQETTRSGSPLKFLSIPKMKSSLSLIGNGSKSSLSRASGDTLRPLSPPLVRSPSQDMLRQSRPSQDSAMTANLPATPNSQLTFDSRISIDRVRQSQDSGSNLDIPIGGSVRSILRGPNTPGTGQNVRFFSRDAYKVISPEQSMDISTEPPQTMTAVAPSSASTNTPSETPFLDRVQNFSNPPSSFLTSKGKKGRPSAADVFSPLQEIDTNIEHQKVSELPPQLLPSQMPQVEGFSNFFDTSITSDHSNILNGHDLPPLPPGLGDFAPDEDDPPMTSTPYRSQTNKGKLAAEETVFHSMEKSPMAPDSSTVFYSGIMSPSASSLSADNDNKGHRSQDSMTSSISSRHTNQSHQSLQSMHGSDADSNSSKRLMHSRSSSNSLLSNKSKSKYTVKPNKATKSRSRALSDTVFQNLIRSSSSSAESSIAPQTPEADINDESASSLIMYTSSPQASPGKADPFRADANTYYTPATPPRYGTSPSSVGSLSKMGAGKHQRRTSREESLIFSLQTQLTLRTEMCAQYEADLSARDELVDTLGKKLSRVEEEDSQRKGVLRKWKKRVGELERMVRNLEQEVDNSRQESFERSVMDEASGEALRMLHRRIGELEREREQVSGRVGGMASEIDELKEEIRRGEERERTLRDAIEEAKEEMERMGNVSLNMSFGGPVLGPSVVDEGEARKMAEERERARSRELAWDGERERLGDELSKVRTELEEALAATSAKDRELQIVKQELEAQWGHTEAAGEKAEVLDREKDDLQTSNSELKQKIDTLSQEKSVLVEERDALAHDLKALEEKLSRLEVDWTDTENVRTRLESEVKELHEAKEQWEKEREELEEQLGQERQQTDELTQALQERDDHIAIVEEERQLALENVERLENNLQNLDGELTTSTQLNNTRLAECENLREELSSLQRNQTHAASDQQRQLEEALSRESDSHKRLEEAVKASAKAETENSLLEDRVKSIANEMDRLRRQIHELKQESADKEVKLVNADKQRTRDREDIEAFNIALDSKQQELELLKRRLGVRGTAGSTPAQPSKIAPRRDSHVFSTPVSTSRPSSVASDTSIQSKDTPSVMQKSANPVSSGRIPALRTSAVKGSMGHPPSRPSLSGIGSTPRASSTNLKAGSAASSTMKTAHSTSRSSLAGTPTPTVAARVASLTRQSSIGTSSAPQRKPLAKIGSRQPSVDEKENESEKSDPSSKRRSLLATPA